MDSLRSCRHRIPPELPGGRVIPQNKLEGEVTGAFYRICKEGCGIEEALNIGQQNLEELVRQHS
jgi:hypothetical protein